MPKNYHTIVGLQIEGEPNNEISLKLRCSKSPSKGNDSSIHNHPARRQDNHLTAWNITSEKKAAFLVWTFKKGSLVMPSFLMLHLSISDDAASWRLIWFTPWHWSCIEV